VELAHQTYHVELTLLHS